MGVSSRRERPSCRRKRSVIGLLALVASAIFLLPASQASAAEFNNACVNSLIPTQSSLIPVTMTANASPNPVEPGNSVTLSEIKQELAIPPAVFISGYNAGVLATGLNEIPTELLTRIIGTNTVEGEQLTNKVATEAETFITDPDGTPGTGDEEATPGTVSVTYENQTWTAKEEGPIDFREKTQEPLTNLSAGIQIESVVSGVIHVRFGCDPGDVEESAPPETIELVNPAVPFASTEIEAPANEPPTANAGPDQTVASGAEVELDGSGSSDPNGDEISYQWSQTGGPAVSLEGAETATPSFTAPTGPAALEFELEVCDPSEACETDSVAVSVEAPANEPPTANAGPDQTVASGAEVELDGSGSSDPNGDEISYQWSQTGGPAVSLEGAETATPSFTAPTGPAALEFELEVCDPSEACETDSVAVSVEAPANEPPTANAGPDQTVASGAEVELDGSGSSDPNGDEISYQWSQTGGPAVSLEGAETATPSFTAPTGPAALEFELEVCDPSEACETDSVAVSVEAPANEPPTANAGPDQTVASGAEVELDGSGSSDPNGDEISYQWSQTGGPAVSLEGAETATPSFTAPTGPAALEFELEVCDPSEACETDSVAVSVEAPANEPPTGGGGGGGGAGGGEGGGGGGGAGGGGGGGTGGAKSGTANAAAFAQVKGGKAFLKLSCRGGSACRGSLQLIARVKAGKSERAKHSKKRIRNLVIGRAGFAIPAGRTKTIRVRLTGKGKALLRKAGRRGLKVKLRGSGISNRAVRLRSPRKQKRKARGGS